VLFNKLLGIIKPLSDILQSTSIHDVQANWLVEGAKNSCSIHVASTSSRLPSGAKPLSLWLVLIQLRSPLHSWQCVAA